MSSVGAKEVNFSLKLMINKKKSKVLFASVDHTFADVLLSFLTLPLGQCLKLLESHCGDQVPNIGSLKTLYNGLQNLDDVYFETKAGKRMLLNPKSSLLEEECCKLKLDITGSVRKYFACACSLSTFRVSLYHEGAICRDCGKLMDIALNAKNFSNAAKGDAEIFTKQTVSFLLSDDLRMVPNVTIGSLIQNLKKLGITDIHGAQLNTVTVGFNEMMDLLKGLLFSRTPLTDTFLNNGRKHNSATTKSELLYSRPQLKEDNCSSSKKMKIKAVIQKSRNKFLFAQAEQDFIEFLFSLLTIPLGQVERLLNANLGLGSIDALYRSVADLSGDQKCWVTRDTKDNLLNPKLPHKYLCNNHIFPLGEQSKPKLYCHKSTSSDYEWYFSWYSSVYYSHEVSFTDPKGQMGNYVKRNGMFMVTDALTVTPLFMHSSLSTLMAMKVPLTDIEELEINIGLEEAFNILKASLTSTRAMTDGLKLNTTAPRKKPKLEN